MRRNRAEATLQQQVVHLLTTCGYTVMEIGKSRGKTRCVKCGNWSYSTGWQGNTVGAPDLYIHHKQWNFCSIGIELKTEKGSVRKEQQQFSEQQLIVICRSIEDVIQQVLAIDKMFGNETKLEKLTWI